MMRGESLTKSYRRGSETVHAIEDVDIALEPGEIVGLVGPSGSGKTTLLYLLAGWEEPDGGRLLWEGNVTSPGELRWSDMALVPQSLGLVEELTVRENVTLPLRLLKQDVDDATVDELLSQLGLGDLAERYPLETSLGEQQRSAVARALVTSPRVILADEPTGHQDAGWAEAVFFLLGRAASEGVCCLIATHDPEVARFSDRVIAMKDGRVDEPTSSTAPARRDDSVWAPARDERSAGA